MFLSLLIFASVVLCCKSACVCVHKREGWCVPLVSLWSVCGRSNTASHSCCYACCMFVIFFAGGALVQGVDREETTASSRSSLCPLRKTKTSRIKAPLLPLVTRKKKKEKSEKHNGVRENSSSILSSLPDTDLVGWKNTTSWSPGVLETTRLAPVGQ